MFKRGQTATNMQPSSSVLSWVVVFHQISRREVLSHSWPGQLPQKRTRKLHPKWKGPSFQGGGGGSEGVSIKSRWVGCGWRVCDIQQSDDSQILFICAFFFSVRGKTLPLILNSSVKQRGRRDMRESSQNKRDFTHAKIPYLCLLFLLV